MNKEEIVNEVMGSFKMTVDTKGIKKLEEYIDNIEQQNKKYKEVIFKIKMIISARIKEYQKKIDNEIDMGSQGDHYLIPKDVFIELFNEMSNWKEETKELNQKYLNAVADYEKTEFENKQLKDKLSKIETLIINHNCDTGDIYYKYNSRFIKSELKQRILEIVYEEGSDSNE